MAGLTPSWPYWRSRRDRYHRATADGTACGANTRDMIPSSLMYGGTVCHKCFPSGAIAV